MTEETNRIFCDNCGCYLGEAPLMMHDEYGRPTFSVAFCPHCGAEVDADGVKTAKPREIDAWFEECWKIYPKHTSKVMARKTFEFKLPKEYEAAHNKAVQIYRTIKRMIDYWDDQDTEQQFIPYMASWLNANFETVRKTKRRKKQ